MAHGLKVVVIHPGQVVGNDAIDYPHVTNLAAAGLVSVLKARGIFTHLLDAFALPGATFRPLRQGNGLYGLPPAALLGPLADADFDVAIVHFTPYHLRLMADSGLQHLITNLRRLRPQSRLIGAELYAGGMHRLPVDEQRLSSAYPELDHFVSLEGEETLPELILGDPGRPFFIKGKAAGIETLSGALIPAWSDDQIGHFAAFLERLSPLPKLRQYRVDRKTLPISFSRGCPFNCSFCSNPYQDYRPLPLEAIAAYLDWASSHGVERLFALDDAANVRPDFEALLSLVAERGFDVEFPNGLRADLLDEARVNALANVCSQLTISAESAVTRLQKDVVGKNVHLAHIERVATWCHDAGLPLSIHWLIALPGETRRETTLTLDAARRLLDERGAKPLLQYATPLPGTRLAESFPGEPASGGSMQHGPTYVPEETTADELDAAVRLVRQRAQDAATAKVIINLTYRCNNHCVFCAVGNRVQKDLETDHVKGVLKRYASQGVELLDLDGGEPTLHPDLFDIVSSARELGYRTINITSNGRRLAYVDFARRLLGSGISSLLVSLHGPNATIHDGITGVPGSFKESMQGIQNILRFADSNLDFGVNITLSEPNYRHLEAQVETLMGLGVEKFNIQFLTPFGRAAADLVPSPEDAARVVRATIDRFSSRARFQVINLPYCYLPGLEDYVAQDLGKLSRNMVFVTGEEVNLYQYLADTRAYGEDCQACLYRVGCDGKYDFSEVHD